MGDVVLVVVLSIVAVDFGASDVLLAAFGTARGLLMVLTDTTSTVDVAVEDDILAPDERREVAMLLLLLLLLLLLFDADDVLGDVLGDVVALDDLGLTTAFEDRADAGLLRAARGAACGCGSDSWTLFNENTPRCPLSSSPTAQSTPSFECNTDMRAPAA
jgi:hypothetical protein